MLTANSLAWPKRVRARGPPLGRRGHPRRPVDAGQAGPRHPGARPCHLPGRRLRAPLEPLGKTSPDAVAVVPQRVELWLLNSMGGEGLDALDECVSSGMIVPDTAGVAFRHELARLAVEGSSAWATR